MARLTVLHVLEALSAGTSRHLVDVVRHVPDVDHVVAIPTERVGHASDRVAERRLRDAGARVHVIEMRRIPVHPRNATALVALRRLVRRERPDVIHAHSSIGGVLGRVVARATGLPAVYTPNGVAQGRLAETVERRLGRITDRFIAVSTSERDAAVAAGFVPPERAVVIANGIEPEPPAASPPDLRARFDIPRDAPLIGTIARLSPQKAPERFVRIVRAVVEQRPEVHAVMVGEGVLQPEFDRAIAEAGVGAHLHQIPSLDDAWATLDQLAVFVLTSRFEGGPYAPLEASRAGVPVVLTDVVGSRDAVDRGVTGLLVPEDDEAGFASAVVGLLDDPTRAAAMGAAGAGWVRAHADVRAQGVALGELYDAVISERRTRAR